MSLSLRTALILTVPPLMWSANAVVGRLMVGLVPPLQLNLWRWALALSILLPLGWRVVSTAPQRRALWAKRSGLVWLGLLGVGVYNALQYVALNSSTPLNVTLIAASSPVWMLGIGAVFYGQRPTAMNLLGAALSLAGVATVLSRGDLSRLAEVQFVLGDVLMVLAIMSWGVYSWMLARPPAVLRDGLPKASDDWAGLLLIQTLFGIGWAAAAAGVEALVVPASTQWSWGVAAAIVFIALGPSLLAYRCWGLGVAQAGPTTAGFFVNLTPVFAAVLQGLWLGEWPQAYHGLAFGLVLAGIAVSGLKR